MITKIISAHLHLEQGKLAVARGLKPQWMVKYSRSRYPILFVRLGGRRLSLIAFRNTWTASQLIGRDPKDDPLIISTGTALVLCCSATLASSSHYYHPSTLHDADVAGLLLMDEQLT